METSIKIAQSHGKGFIMDVTEHLKEYQYHETAKEKEDEYAGKIIISITESETHKHKKAYLDKDKAKMLCYAIYNLQFWQLFGESGFVEHGVGSIHHDKLPLRSFGIRQLKTTDKGILFQMCINEWKTKDEVERVMAVVSMKDMVTIAHEVYDYIQQAELVAMQKGKPLHTITYSGNEVSVSGQALIQTKEHIEDYIVPFGSLKGMKLGNMKTEQLKSILKSQVNTEVVRDIKHRAKELLQRRAVR